jgi:hypothetical protein
MTNHRNDERTVRCPVEGCDATPLARGVNLHILRSSGEGHGPNGEVPDHISTEDLETVGNREVEMDYPAERDTEGTARLCPYCTQPFAGKNGVLIHLGAVAGRLNHPEDAAEKHAETDFPKVNVDEQGNITSVLGDTPDTGKGAVSQEQVYHLIAEFMANGDTQAAQRVRRKLLGIESGNRSLWGASYHNALFHALVIHSQAGPTEKPVTAAIEREGIMVACRGESSFYDAEEARGVADGLERATSDDPRQEDIRDLIGFLRYGADKLEDAQERGRFHEEFQRWR